MENNQEFKVTIWDRLDYEDRNQIQLFRNHLVLKEFSDSIRAVFVPALEKAVKVFNVWAKAVYKAISKDEGLRKLLLKEVD
ncbi:MAG: hypothetical protein PWR10_1566 [Halanaerobiales bacterium]|nr:hypothetical protein [Halanaerobiales bacterium]